MWNITAIKQSNAAHGWHYFERGTMRFFRSRVLSYVYEGPGGVFFVTSEQFEGSGGYRKPRAFTVRKFNPETGDVSTHGEFNVLGRSAALTAAKLAAAQPEETRR